MRGIYHLIDEDKDTKEREYLNFGSRKRFLDLKDCDNPNTSLSVIDSLTTLFLDEKDFRSYLKDDMETYRDRLIYITYKNNGEKKLACVYNDKVLHDIAEKTLGSQGGSVNLSDNLTKSYLYSMFREIKDPNSTFVDEVLARTKPSYSINDHNKELISEIRSDTAYTQNYENFQLTRFLRNFTSYKEFRALYLNYKEYKKRMELKRQKEYDENKEELKQLIKSKKKNREVPGQISMFGNNDNNNK